MDSDPAIFPSLSELSWLSHGFVGRQNSIETNVERSEALQRLFQSHKSILNRNGIQWNQMRFGEQVHGNRVELVSSSMPSKPILGVDGLITQDANVSLGIYVADCCAIYLVEKEKKMVGLLHSGKKGTEQNIAGKGVKKLVEAGGSVKSITAALSPCIHGCCYEVDIVKQIQDQLAEEGIADVWTHPDCTGCHLDRYYSYRKEMGKTGRMLAFMMIKV